jgi:hypothetical protein
MQRMIIEALDESKRWMADVKTERVCSFLIVRGRYWNHQPTDNDPFVVRVNGKLFFLDEDTFDLSATLRYLAEKHGKMESYVHDKQVSPKFLNSFWRAAKRLIQTGYLVRWVDGTNRIVEKGLRLTQIKDKCVTTVAQHLTQKKGLSVGEHFYNT